MLIRISTHLTDVVVTLQPTEGIKETPTGARYEWRLGTDEAVRLATALLKASEILDEKNPPRKVQISRRASAAEQSDSQAGYPPEGD